MPSVFGLLELGRIVLLRAAPWDGKRSPRFFLHHFSDVNDLSNMVRVVRQLAVEGLHNAMALVADVDDGTDIIFVDGVESLKETGPAFVPFFQQGFPAWQVIVEFGLPLPPFFFAISGEEVRPAAEHIAPKVLDDGGNTVAFGIVLPKKLFVGQLLESLFAKRFVVFELFADAGKVIVQHG